MATIEEKDTILCGNSETGIVQSGCNSNLRLFANGSLVLKVEPTLLTIYARISRVKGSNAASNTVVTLPLNGTLFHVTGTTDIQHITTTGWSEGSAIVLIFKGALTVENATASPPVNTADILLNNGVNFSAQVNSTLSLVYDGEHWFETGRKI